MKILKTMINDRYKKINIQDWIINKETFHTKSLKECLFQLLQLFNR